MNWKDQLKPFLWITGAFFLLFYLPIGWDRFDHSIFGALQLAQTYAREHFIPSLLPAFLIAGGIAAFVNQNTIIRCLGSRANPFLAYSVASVSGAILTVCSCTVLPLFSGVYKKGAGLGPAIAFLYSSPAINVTALVLTWQILGWQIGLARALGAIGFSVFIGLLMNWIFRNDKSRGDFSPEKGSKDILSTPQLLSFFALLVAILVFSNLSAPESKESSFYFIRSSKWFFTGLTSAVLAIALISWLKVKTWKILLAALFTAITAFLFRNPIATLGVGVLSISIAAGSSKGSAKNWIFSSFNLLKQITPPLVIGILLSGFFLGHENHEGIIPSAWIQTVVGGNSLQSSFFSSIISAFIYFCTLAEVPIVQGLMTSGMGKGPALALLLAGPALSLPQLIVLNSLIGLKKTSVYAVLVVIMATFCGWLFGMF